MGQTTDPNQEVAEAARQEALDVLSKAATFDDLVNGIRSVYEKRRPRHGHEAAQLLNFLEFKDPTKVVDVPLDLVRAALSRIAKNDPGDARPAEFLKLIR
jgi:hypothetical protein